MNPTTHSQASTESSKRMSSLTYRPDVDGLRAVAVIGVLLHHCGLGFTGGYVGVDVFFVISGYLITTIILRQLQNNAFSLLTFWHKRIRRLMPAMLVMVLASLAVGWLILIPDDFVALSNAVIAQTLFVANVYFYRTTNYFAAAAESKPLLHTWSLSVEEQFYFILPLLLIIIWRVYKPALKPLFILSFFASLALSIYVSKSHASANYYLLPTRAWELACGAIIPIFNLNHAAAKLKPTHVEALSLIGIVSIILPMFIYDHHTTFPGLTAIPPCLGTVLIIWANTYTKSHTAKLLALKPVVLIGLISYSLYLWHWPILSYTGYFYGRISLIPLHLKTILILASLLMGYLSWRYIEQVFRHRGSELKIRNSLAFAAFTCALLVSLGLIVKQADGFTSRYPAQTLTHYNQAKDKGIITDVSLKQARNAQFLKLGTAKNNPNNTQPPVVLLWGDSHAQALIVGLDAWLQQNNLAGLAAVHASTPPILNYNNHKQFSLKDKSPAFNQTVLDYIIKHKIKNVVLAAKWNAPFENNTSDEHFKQQLKRTINQLQQHDINIIIFAQVPSYPFNIPRAMAIADKFMNSNQHIHTTINQHLQSPQFAMFNELNLNPLVLDIHPQFISPDNPNQLRPFINNRACYWDHHHLNVYGSKYINNTLARKFILTPPTPPTPNP